MNAATKARLGIKDALWVPASKIMEITGWDNEKMKEARAYKWLHFEKRINPRTNREGIMYDLNSLDERLYKK